MTFQFFPTLVYSFRKENYKIETNYAVINQKIKYYTEYSFYFIIQYVVCILDQWTVESILKHNKAGFQLGMLPKHFKLTFNS